MTIWNATQHAASPEQLAAGVRDLPKHAAAAVRAALTVDDLPDRLELERRAEAFAQALAPFVEAGDQIMLGGAPWLMAALEFKLAERGWRGVYAFSRRASVDQPQPDGSVRKVAVFRHAGFVPAFLGDESLPAEGDNDLWAECGTTH